MDDGEPTDDQVERAAFTAWLAYCTPDGEDVDERWDPDESTIRERATQEWKEAPNSCTHIGAAGFRKCARAALCEALKRVEDE